MIGLYQRVCLVGDAHVKEGVSSGALGYVIEIYSDGSYEVEFSDAKTGISFAQLVLREDELQLAPEEIGTIFDKKET